EVPADPQRVVVLSSYAGDLIELGVPVVGADAWSLDNPNFKEGLKDAEEVSDESIEKFLELEPDLIIGLSNIKNYEKLSEIAPTVTFTYGKEDYLQQHIEIGKSLTKKKKRQHGLMILNNGRQILGIKCVIKLEKTLLYLL